VPFYDGRIGPGMAVLGSRTSDEDYGGILPGLRALCGRPGGCNAYLPPLTPTTPLPGGGGDDVTTGDRHCYAHPMCILPSGALGLGRDLS
jgi:hypothetical protein